MSRKIKKIIKSLSVLLSAIFISGLFNFNSVAEEPSYPNLELDCRSAILMEAETGNVLYAKNENESLPPASVTKVMTLLLVMEAIEDKSISLTDMVSASERACSMGGSQIYLEVGERMTVEDLLKSVVIASANDAAVALAEYIAGEEGAFVEMMNKKARELGMENSNFENTNGLDDSTQNHVCSARDIAVMSRELIKYDKITEYSRIWMDTIRDGAFGLTNTNRLVRFYQGATGLKTGSTSKAGFCITATAERDGMTLIAVVMASPSRDARNSAAVAMLNYGFSNFTIYRNEGIANIEVNVSGGVEKTVLSNESEFVTVVSKKSLKNIVRTVEIYENLTAPIEVGDVVGAVTYTLDGVNIETVKIIAVEGVRSIGFFDLYLKILAKITLK